MANAQSQITGIKISLFSKITYVDQIQSIIARESEINEYNFTMNLETSRFMIIFQLSTDNIFRLTLYGLVVLEKLLKLDEKTEMAKSP